MEYEVEEKGYAQFLCKISLPVDAPSGVNTVAEATVKGEQQSLTNFQIQIYYLIYVVEIKFE